MRLDHLLSKDRFCGGGFLVVGSCLGRVVGSGPAGGLLPAESRVAGWCSGVLPVWWVLGWGWLPGAGIGDAPAAAWSAGWWVSLRGVGVACCRGSGAVRPGCLARFFCSSLFVGGVGVGVGGLVVNCIVDASILL